MDFGKNYPITKYVTFLAIISVYVHTYGPKFDLMDSFRILVKMNLKVLENSKIIPNLGIQYESRQYVGNSTVELLSWIKWKWNIKHNLYCRKQLQQFFKQDCFSGEFSNEVSVDSWHGFSMTNVLRQDNPLTNCK